MEAKILIPLDDSPTSVKTVAKIISLRDQFATGLTLVHIINKNQLAYRLIPDFQLEIVRENAVKAAWQLLRRYEGQLAEAGLACQLVVETGEPRHAITRMANDQGFGLLVIGRHQGGGEIRDVLFGSVANYVLHNVRCPVLLF